MTIELGDELQRLGIATVGGLGIGPGSKEVPACAAGGLGIGSDDLDVFLHKVVPVLDALGIALAHQEDDGRGIGRAVVRQTLLPAGVDQLLVQVEGIDVTRQCQGDDIGLQAIDHRAGLLAGATMGILDAHVFAGLGLPVLGEGGVVLLVELTGRIVGHVEQLDGLDLTGEQGAGECGHGEAAKGHGKAP